MEALIPFSSISNLSTTDAEKHGDEPKPSPTAVLRTGYSRHVKITLWRIVELIKEVKVLIETDEVEVRRLPKS